MTTFVGTIRRTARNSHRLERVERIALAWVTGSTPKRPGVERGGRAVIEHMLHESTGMTVTFDNGRHRPIPAFRRAETIRFRVPVGAARVYDLGHAELTTSQEFPWAPGGAHAR